MTNLIAQFISLISNPVFLSVPLSYALVFNRNQDAYYALWWALASLIFAGVVGGFVYWGVKRGMFSDMDVSVREQRPPLFIFASVVGLVYFVLIFLLDGPRILLVGLGALLLGIFIADLVNKKIKASIHLAVFSAFAIVLGILYGGIFWFLIFLAPVVAWSRIKLKRHVIEEIIVGTILGTILVIMVYLVVQYLSSNV